MLTPSAVGIICAANCDKSELGGRLSVGRSEKDLNFGCWTPLFVAKGNEGAGRCFIVSITMSAITSASTVEIRIPRDSAPRSPSASKAPIISIIFSTGDASLFKIAGSDE
uniref:Uncharacterized protein n=1 Tax=Arundo donax TaxID=35708 RepID=A0A0A9EV11_ARUDO